MALKSLFKLVLVLLILSCLGLSACGGGEEDEKLVSGDIVAGTLIEGTLTEVTMADGRTIKGPFVSTVPGNGHLVSGTMVNGVLIKGELGEKPSGAAEGEEAGEAGEAASPEDKKEKPKKAAAKKAEPKKAATPKKPKMPTVSAESLLDTYSKYEDKVIKIKGKVWKVMTKKEIEQTHRHKYPEAVQHPTKKNFFLVDVDKPYVTLKAGSLFTGVQCFFDKKFIPKLDELAESKDLKEKEIIIVGKVKGKFKNVFVEDCRLN